MTEAKKYFLSAEEQNNMKSRRASIGFIIDLIERDMNAYLFEQVLPRLGIKPEQGESIETSKDFDFLTVLPKEDKSPIIKPGQPEIVKPN